MIIEKFDDFCLVVYVIVDDLMKEIDPVLRRPGPKPECSDSELITMTLVGECKGWDKETDLLSNMQAYWYLFPVIPTQSRYNRRRRNLMMVFNLVRQTVLSRLDLAQDHQCVIDSLPIPVLQFHLVPGSNASWGAYGADYGKVMSKGQTIFGYKLHLLVTMGGLILDFELAPASATDVEVGFEMLAEHTDLAVIGDKAYISGDKADDLNQHNRISMVTLPRSNQKPQLSAQARYTINAVRQIIETVNGQLDEQFNIETNHAYSFWGLCTRLYSKLTAHTLCIFINRLLGKSDFLQIKSLAFPI